MKGHWPEYVMYFCMGIWLYNVYRIVRIRRTEERYLNLLRKENKAFKRVKEAKTQAELDSAIEQHEAACAEVRKALE